MKQTVKEIAKGINLDLPNKKTESYRYFDIETLLDKSYDTLDKNKQDIKESKILKIVDGIVTQAPKNLDISYKKERDIYAKHFDPMYHFSHKINSDVIFIDIKEDIELKILHQFEAKDTLISYRIVFNVKENTTTKLYETFIGCDAKDSFVLYGYDLIANRYSNVEIVKDETLVKDTYTPIYTNFIDAKENANVKLFSFDFGNSNGLQLFDSNINQNATVESKHLLYIVEDAKRGTVSRLNHTNQNAKSNQVAKSILQDSARGIFDATIKIDSTAAGSKAHQNSKAVLLNDGAYMASKPQLVINIDDVEASHGSTIGELDEKQLFYLRSRGIESDEAKKMLILAFANEIIDDISSKDVVNAVHNSFETVYYGKGQLECIATCHFCEESILKD